MNSTQSIILNGQVVKQETYSEPLGIFYEVMRLKDGSLLFYEDHFQRLRSSLATVIGAPQITMEQFVEDIELLLNVDGVKNQNIKYVYFNQMGEWIRSVYYIPSNYPSPDTYMQGVYAKSVYFERSQPDVKQMSKALRDIRIQMENEGVFDFLCMNHDGFITEGTKTNVFMLKDKRLFTAPDSDVLGGITRKKIIQLATSLGIEVVYRCLSLKETLSCDAIFFSGTSIGILPISKLDNHNFNFTVCDDLLNLMGAFQKAIILYQLKKPFQE